MKKPRNRPKKSLTNHDMPTNLPLLAVGVYNAVIGTVRIIWMFFHHGS
jgi:hypothetical protein